MSHVLISSMPGLIAIRFFCGVFASSGPALGVATCADVSSSTKPMADSPVYNT